MKDLIAPQPAPTPTDTPASWDQVRADLRERHGSRDVFPLVDADAAARDQFGFEKYGVRIQAGNGRDSMVDAYQELLDGAVYFRTALDEMMTRDGADPRLSVPLAESWNRYNRLLALLMDTRQAIEESALRQAIGEGQDG
jgi:hypothetical protein